MSIFISVSISNYICICISVYLHLSHTCWRDTAVQLENIWCTGWLHKNGYDVTQLWLTHFLPALSFSLLRCFTTSGFNTLRWSSSFLKFCLLDPSTARTDNSVSCSPFWSTLHGSVVSIFAGQPCHKLYCKFTCC